MTKIYTLQGKTNSLQTCWVLASQPYFSFLFIFSRIYG
jgi:hypothetical protein